MRRTKMPFLHHSSPKPRHRFFTSTILHRHPLPPPPPPPTQIYQTTHSEKSLISLIKSCLHKAQLQQIHAHLILTSSFVQNHNLFLHFLTRISLPPQQDLYYSRKAFIQYPKPNISLYNVMFRAYSVSHNESHEGFMLFREMLSLGISPNSLSASLVIKCCVKMNAVHFGLLIHAQIFKCGYQTEVDLGTTLMDFYSLGGNMSDACKLFDEMIHKDIVAYNVLISCFMRNGRTRGVLNVFDCMITSVGCKPNSVSCLLTIQACANLGALDFGKKVHMYVEQNGFGDDINVYNALITMYMRCGCVEKAYEVFKEMAKTDVVSWTAVVSGLARNGYRKDAIDAFSQMVREGIVPDHHTFTGVLSACSHQGLIEEGQMLFDMMSREFGILPNIYHYGCLVDLMSRAGLLYEAYRLIISMTVKPDAAIWRTLLGACKVHRNAVLGEQVVQHLIELKAQEARDYVLLLNLYTSAGSWEKVKEVKKLMEENQIHSTPGCSTMELKGEVHKFDRNDVLHPHKDEIYAMLDEINKQLKIGGYVAEITSELQSNYAEEKQLSLSYHSEKLAIAFGVLSTPPGTKIKVAKDLFMCNDSHNFAKMVSAVYNREVVIRDQNGFHSFQNGQCSCSGL